jgi:hypothetical protein
MIRNARGDRRTSWRLRGQNAAVKNGTSVSNAAKRTGVWNRRLSIFGRSCLLTGQPRIRPKREPLHSNALFGQLNQSDTGTCRIREATRAKAIELLRKLSMNDARTASVSRNAQRHRSRSRKRHSKQSGVFVDQHTRFCATAPLSLASSASSRMKPIALRVSSVALPM